MTIVQVQYVLAVARYLSITKAADELFISQPALSAQIKKIEEELRCALFHREPQGVSLTAAGQAFCADARLVEEAWTRLEQGCGLLKNTACKNVRVGIGPRAIANGLFDDIVSFFKQYADTNVTVITDIGENVLQALDEKRMDLAIDRLPPPFLFHHEERYRAVELLRERQCILLSKSDPRAAWEEFPFAALDGTPVVLGPEGASDDLIMRWRCREHGIEPSKIHRADNLEGVMLLIENGAGSAMGPPSFTKRYRVAAVPMTPLSEISLNLICLRQNEKDPIVQQLSRYLKAKIRRSADS